MSTITAPDTTSVYTEYWDNRQHQWIEYGDHGYGTVDDVPTTPEQARAEAESAWGTYLQAAADEDAETTAYRLVWATPGGGIIATVEIDVVRDDDTNSVIGYELGAVELYQP